MKILLALVLVLLAVGASPKVEDCNMAVTFDGDNFIKFGEEADLFSSSITQFTFMARFVATTIAGGNSYGIIKIADFDGVPAYVNQDLGRLYISTAGSLAFDIPATSGDGGSWDVEVVLSVDTKYHMTITFDNSGNANNPLIYFDGVSQTVRENVTPTALPITYNDLRVLLIGDISIGSPFTSAFIGDIFDVRVYDRILSASEILDIFNSKTFDGNDNGLVFHCPLLGAAGLQTFEGASLTTAKEVSDRMRGKRGVPQSNGSDAVGKGETLLHFGGLQWEEGRGGG